MKRTIQTLLDALPVVAAFLMLVVMAIMASACATPRIPEPVIITEEVLVPTPVPCLIDAPDAPDYPDSKDNLKNSKTPEDRLNRVVAGRLIRIVHAHELEQALAACTGDAND